MMIELPKDKFTDSYFSLTKDKVIISQIRTTEQGKGYFSELLDFLFRIRNRIEVPTPSNQMKDILIKKGFRFEKIWFGEGFDCYGDILIKEISNG